MKRVSRRNEEKATAPPPPPPQLNISTEICMTMGDAFQKIQDTFASCKTVPEFKKARVDTAHICLAAQTKVALLVVQKLN
jgi:hypothetical protein